MTSTAPNSPWSSGKAVFGRLAIEGNDHPVVDNADPLQFMVDGVDNVNKAIKDAEGKPVTKPVTDDELDDEYLFIDKADITRSTSFNKVDDIIMHSHDKLQMLKDVWKTVRASRGLSDAWFEVQHGDREHVIKGFERSLSRYGNLAPDLAQVVARLLSDGYVYHLMMDEILYSVNKAVAETNLFLVDKTPMILLARDRDQMIRVCADITNKSRHPRNILNVYMLAGMRYDPGDGNVRWDTFDQPSVVIRFRDSHITVGRRTCSAVIQRWIIETQNRT